MVAQVPTEWALLSYRIPREPSTPRIAVWRRIKALGAVKVGDGLVALPATAKTTENLEWLAESIIEAAGEAIVWKASTARRDSSAMADQMRAERDAEYQAVRDEIRLAARPVDSRSIARWRREVQRIDRRDYFTSPERESTKQAIAGLAAPPSRSPQESLR